MIPRTRLPESLLSLAARQAGAVSREQLLGFGVSDRVIHRLHEDGRLERITLGVYATSKGGWSQRAWAGVLLGGPTAVLGGSAAGYLQGLVKQQPDQVLVFSDTRRQRDQRWRLVCAARLGTGEPPRTRLAQTVVDLAVELDADDIVSVVAEAVGRKQVRPQEIRRALGETARHPHRKLLEDLVSEVAAGSRSPLEVRYARHVERAHGLPVPRRQESPLSRLNSDVWYPDYGVLIELDGRQYHSGMAAVDDMDRDNDHQLAGVVTLRLSWRQVVSRPCQTAAKVGRVLRSRGWEGMIRRCPNCRAGS